MNVSSPTTQAFECAKDFLALFVGATGLWGLFDMRPGDGIHLTQ
jgi:hypothetical protein